VQIAVATMCDLESNIESHWGVAKS